MIRRFSFFLCLLFLVACDDGDILTVDLEFDQELESCDDFEDSYVIFDTREDPNEALILIFERSITNDALFATENTLNITEQLDISDDDVRFIYRTYNRALDSDDICAVVPPADLTIREDYEADSGTVDITVTIVDDDGDGVPSISEYGPGGFTNPQDSDGDGIFDYLDEDDDGDNVKTSVELDTDDDDGDGNPLTNPLDTDSDGIPDYLDVDDDGDGIDTRLEDENGINGPGDDQALNAEQIQVPHYLNPDETISYVFDDYNAFVNTYTRTVTTSFIISDIDLGILRSEVVDFGALETSIILPLIQ